MEIDEAKLPKMTGFDLLEKVKTSGSSRSLPVIVYTGKELTRREEITLNLDYAQSGLGGASCGPGTLPQYLLMPVPVSFHVWLRPLSGDGGPLAELARTRLIWD